MSRLQAVAVGDYHTIYLKNDRTVWTMGWNSNGQLGTGNLTNRTTPIQVATNVLAIAASGSQSFYIKTDGTLWGMGANSSGQLGDGTGVDRVSPVQIATFVDKVAAGRQHMAYLRFGSLWATGNNSSRQLGDGTTITRYLPVQIASGVTFLSASENRTLFGKADGNVWATGSNSYGEFGLGSSGTPTTPIPIIGPPLFVTMPVAKTVNPGVSTTFTALAYGPAPLSYQWRRNGVAITGAMSANYTFVAQEANEGSIDVVATCLDGATTSDAVLLGVNDPVTFTAVPQPLAIMPGQPATFDVAATGTGPLTYLWRKGGVAISGATSSTYTIAAVAAADAATYTCAVTNPVGTVTSAGAALLLGPAITAQPQGNIVNPGGSVVSVTASGSAPTYQLRRDGAPLFAATGSSYGFTASELAEGGYDVVISNAAGSVTSSVAMIQVNDPVVFTSTPQSFSAQPHQPVTCAVTNVVGTAVSGGADLLVSPEITAQPASQRVNPGAAVILSVTATGTGPLTYEWRKNGVMIGTGRTLSLQSVAEADAGDYSVRVSNAAGTVFSEAAYLQVNAPPRIVVAPQSQTVGLGGTAIFTVQVQGAGTVSYQWRKDGVPLTGGNLASFSVGPAGAFDGGVYDVVVTDSVASVRSAGALLTVDQAPRIVRQPAPVSARPGAPVVLSAEVAGASPLTFQWFRNGVAVPRGTGATLDAGVLSPAVAGTYSLQVSNSAGTIRSDLAAVSIALWSELSGTYQALFSPEDEGAPGESSWRGRLTATVNVLGSLSGRLEYEGSTIAFAGKLAPDLVFTKTLARSPRAPLVLRVQMDASLRATLEAGATSPPAGLSAERHPFNASRNPAPQSGRYVLLLPSAQAPGSPAPAAPGYAIALISRGGNVSIVGKLPDGAKIATAGYLGADSVFPWYQALYPHLNTAGGQIAGLAAFEPSSGEGAVSGALEWLKPAQSAGPYRTASNTVLPVEGEIYTAPAAGVPVLELPPGGTGFNLIVAGADESVLFTRATSISSRNVVLVSNPNSERAMLRLNVATGLVTGSFIEAGTRKLRTLEGVLLPFQTAAAGFYVTEAAAGSWSLSAR